MATERTDQGEQYLIDGVNPITQADLLRALVEAPLLPRRAQKPCNIGLFDDDARNQLDLFIHARTP